LAAIVGNHLFASRTKLKCASSLFADQNARTLNFEWDDCELTLILKKIEKRKIRALKKKFGQEIELCIVIQLINRI
jgi:hypothetical protein